MSQEHQLLVQRTARYYTLGGGSGESGPLADYSEEGLGRVQRIWFVLHGYGQLARYFIRRFDVVADAETLVVAPEGLSRLYTDQQNGKVGASWITREARDQEVDDYVAYLDQVLAAVLSNRPLDGLDVTLLGFSQGASTVCRWLDKSPHIRANRLLLWAGYFPNGLSDILQSATIQNLPVTYIYGDQDEYLTQLGDLEPYLNRLKTDVPQLTVQSFPGKHVVDREVLKAIAART